MSSASYFRRQSDLCARLALASSDEEWTKKFTLLSLQYLAKAVELEQAGAIAGPPAGRNAASERSSGAPGPPAERAGATS